MAAFQETQYRVNIEFLRSSQPGVGRVIRFNHGPGQVPPQLQGRISPTQWNVFMVDVDTLARCHPYVQKPKAGDYGKWAACFALGSVVGFCCVSPDAGDYGAWRTQVDAMLQQHQAAFQAAGCSASLQQLSTYEFYIMISIDPHVPVRAVPVHSQEMPPSPFASMKKP